jgi:hypothetical protein
MSKHTPGPYKGINRIVFAGDEQVAFMVDGDQVANCAFIVEACNNYERLRAEKEAAVRSATGAAEDAMKAHFEPIIDGLADALEKLIDELGETFVYHNLVVNARAALKRAGR